MPEPLWDAVEIDHAVEAIGAFGKDALARLVGLLVQEFRDGKFDSARDIGDVPDETALAAGEVSAPELLSGMNHLRADYGATFLTMLEERTAEALQQAASIGIGLEGGTPAQESKLDELRTALYAYSAEKQRAATYAYQKLRLGPLSEQDKRDQREILDLAKAYWAKFPDTSVTAVIRESGIAKVARINPRTVGGWIKHLKPGGTRPGRPKKR